ncbi:MULTISPECIES: SusC/RagA family TonB-linked outer membrane protein [Sphingobacterium]|uniref:SusC/RagA family TonB-linked outer membrane protein n=1 Tax=Sphingobacterium TaxID=28453 RepID=UPI00104E3A64|nr:MULTISPECIES: TonB-dependent receptor [Sphingobacterium]MCW2263376.1 TonB-linked SusC/RagA family outer membrane protein [Sphingobacterium kitahiroshimense]TCR11641.1 TonB-linked SusC/RagA family outer membrane protein [Sphingobacterium sp. JUb78]
MKRKLNVNITGSMTAFVLLFGTVPIAKASSLHYALINAQQTSQNQQIKGKVTDESGKPLVGVTIKVKGTSIGTKTDSEGNFNLNATTNQTLVITYVGYISKEVPIGTNPANLTITLDTEVNMLEETVVVGFGTQKKATLTGAVSVMKSDAISNRPITNATQALSGQVPGVWVNQQSGQPGRDGASIRVRGIGTIGTSDALVIIDGIVGSLGAVNANDIESISVLKDASAAIYGSRAANGVILVQTKKGAKGRVKIDFTTSFGKQTATKLPEMITNSVDYMNLYNQALINQGSPTFFSKETINEYQNGKDPNIYPNTDWLDLIMRNASIQTNQLGISGGEGNTQFNLSLGYTNQDGIVQNGNAKLYNLRANVDTKVNDKLDVGLRSGIRYQNRKESFNGSGNLFTELYRTLPYYGTYTSNGEYASTWVNSVNAQFRNPLAMVNEGKNHSAYGNFNTNVFLNYKILDGLKFNITGGVNYSTNDNQTFVPKTLVYNPKTLTVTSTMNASGPNASNNWDKTLYKTLFSSLTYNKIIAENHDFTIAGIYSQEEEEYRTLSGSIMGFVNNTLTEINAGLTTPLTNGTTYGWALRSYIGRFNYAYKEKYLLEGIARYDGSSRFSPENRWGFFPSISAGWRITQEDFMKNQTLIDELKIRASWGKSGNDRMGFNDQRDLYAYIPTLAFARFYPLSDNIATGIAQMSIVDENIKWEVGTKTNIGFDATLLKRKLNVTFDYFEDKREGILRQIQLPNFIGIRNAPFRNLATVSNKGWELSSNYTHKIGEVDINAGFNLTHVKNKIDYIPDPQIGRNALLQGEAINAFYMWKSLGIFQSQEEVDSSPKQNAVPTKPGDIKFEDFSGPEGKPDGIIDAHDRQVVGKPIPTWTYGANINVSYKGVDLRINLQGVADVESYVGSELYFPFLNGAGVSKRWEAGNTWTPENPNAKLPRLVQYSASNSQNYADNSFWLQDASFLRVKNIQLGYSLPSSLLSKLKMGGIRVYIDAQNVFTFTKFEGLDPERDLANMSPAQYPNVRMITGGINLKF